MPLNAGFTCPNRENGKPGCFFCDETGSGFSTFAGLSIREQLEKMKEKYRKKGIKKFIAYFQNYTNTYAPVDILRTTYVESIDEDIVQLDIATRPDCINEKILEMVDEIRKEYKIEISFDIGLQTANYHTLVKINRGHTLAEYIYAVNLLKKYDFEVVSHVILNLPGDNMLDVVEGAKILSALKVDGVKLHSLYVVEGSVFGEMFKAGRLEVGTLESYVERAVTFLENLSPRIVVHRLVADPPLTGTLFGNWGKTKTEIVNLIERRLVEKDTYQGKKAKII
ncbi:TIGR01212 family radical SAM protein [Fervidobacterium islandicum]|uniref:TIGR01212 family radical SAM protein n=1 Tax=Fervidobacterium islandicum TaxID=2423 RepID=A0AAI8GCN0_FERIS|nr:TIGR01212 family radical SAM protein [Fervidobacterium islandicum]AMW32473.1 TIGR01212 family radical SAM protein [Fervidobacterium islandicum]